MSAKINELVKEISGLTALELAELTKAMEEQFGVSAATPVAAAPSVEGSAGAKAEEEKTSYKVELIETGPEKIKTIKAIRQIKKDIGLTEAKKLTEETPTVLEESASSEDAKKIKEVLEAAGAKVKLS